MKHKFQDAKIVVGENSKEIQEILFGLGYRWKRLGQNISILDAPFLFIYKDKDITYSDNNQYFYTHEHPLITLDTLKQWQRENVELVEGEFYATEKTDEYNYSIFQFKEVKDSFVNVYFGYIYNDNYIHRNCINFARSSNIIRPATPEEIQLLKDKVKEKTGKVFNEETKMFEEPKKEYEFKPFDKVLVRDDKDDEWEIDMYRKKENNVEGYNHVCFYDCWKICIPYEGNEHLL